MARRINRTKPTKKEKIAYLTTVTKMTTAEIATQVDTTPGYVHVALHEIRKNKQEIRAMREESVSVLSLTHFKGVTVLSKAIDIAQNIIEDHNQGKVISPTGIASIITAMSKATDTLCNQIQVESGEMSNTKDIFHQSLTKDTSALIKRLMQKRNKNNNIIDVDATDTDTDN